MAKDKEPNFFSSDDVKETARAIGTGLVVLGGAIVASSAIQAATSAFKTK